MENNSILTTFSSLEGTRPSLNCPTMMSPENRADTACDEDIMDIKVFVTPELMYYKAAGHGQFS